jgi:hypothetical protein
MHAINPVSFLLYFSSNGGRSARVTQCGTARVRWDVGGRGMGTEVGWCGTARSGGAANSRMEKEGCGMG